MEHRASARGASTTRAPRSPGFRDSGFTLAENEDAAWLEVLVESRERETGFLDVRAGDGAVEAIGTGQQVERQPKRLGSAAQQPADGDASLRGQASIIGQASVSTSVSSPLCRYSTLMADVSTSRNTTMPSFPSPISRAASASDIGLSDWRDARRMRGIRARSRLGFAGPAGFTAIASRSSPMIGPPLPAPRRLRPCPLPLFFFACCVILSV